MTTLHPKSSMETARLAARLLGDGSWSHINRVDAREIVSAMERLATWGPAEDSPGARVLDARARRLSALASTAYEVHELLVDGRDLSWLWDPMQMDAIARMTCVY